MDWNTIVILVTLIGCFGTLTAYLSRRDDKISNDGEFKGMVNAKLDAILGIDTRTGEVEKTVRNHEGRLCKLEGSTSSAHKRLDDYIGGKG